MKVVNLTPHVVNIKGYGHIATSDMAMPRVKVICNPASKVAGITVYASTYGQVENIPAKQDGVIYIVSRMVACALPERRDFYIPSGLVRDTEGRVTGCLGLEQVY